MAVLSLFSSPTPLPLTPLLSHSLSLTLTLFVFLQWKREIDNKVTLPNGSPLPVVLLANKCDLPDTRVNKEELDSFCKEHGFVGWYETSAKSNHNVEEGVKGLVSNILSHPDAFEAHRLKAQQQQPAGAVSLADDKKGGKGGAAGGDGGSKGGCC